MEHKTVNALAEQMRTRVLLLDGAMGTELQARGLAPGTPPEFWTVEHPEVVLAIHRAYLEAGSDIILTNTFGANRLRLNAYTAGGRVQELNATAVDCALSAAACAGRPVWVAGSMGPLGQKTTFTEAVEVFGEQVRALARAGCTVFLLETMTDLTQAEAAVTAVHENAPRGLIMVMMSFGRNGRLLTGETPEMVAAALERFSVSGVGANCSFGPDSLLPVIERMAKTTSLPVAAKPNAGIPVPLSAQAFADWGERFVRAGARLIGGCCGTTPAHIRALAACLGVLHLYPSPVPSPSEGEGGVRVKVN